MSLPSVWLSALAGGLIFLTTVPGEGEEQVAATPSKQTTAQTGIHNGGIIAIPDVAARATEVADLIRESNAKLASGAEIKAIDESLPDTARLIDLEAWMTTQMLRQQPTLDSLERQQLLWQQRQEITTSWLNTLTHRANSLQDILNRLSELNQTWTATRAAAQAANAPQPILQQIDEALGAIATAETPLDSQRTAVLDLQARVAREVAQCGSVLAEIDRSQQKVVSGILVRKSAIWSGKLWAGAGQALHDRVRRISNTLLQGGLEYLRDPSKGMPMHVALLVLLTLLFRVVRWKRPMVNHWPIRVAGIKRVPFPFRRRAACHLGYPHHPFPAGDSAIDKRDVPGSGVRADNPADTSGSRSVGDARALLS
ncbi:MAG: hypothetical protein WBL40_08665 [Terrimicrobiaceae bacterium]